MRNAGALNIVWLVAVGATAVGCPRPDLADASLDGQADASAPLGAGCIGDPSGALGRGTCAAGLECLSDLFGFPNGYCVQACSAAQPCPSGATCVDPAGARPVCLQACTRDADCRADEGYRCAHDPDGDVCRPELEPVGTRDGQACFTVAAGPHAAPPLARATFAAPNLSVSAARADSVSEADGNVAINPRRAVVATPYIAVAGSASFIGSSAVRGGNEVVATGVARDPVSPLNADPTVAYTSDGTLHVAFLGYRLASLNSSDTRIWVADSRDDGATWEAPRAVDPPGLCATRCDKPWLAAGPAPGGSGEYVYVAYLVEHPGVDASELVVQRSADDGGAWSPPARLASVETVAGARVAPQLARLAVDSAGVVHAVYVGYAPDGDAATLLGDARARVVYRASRDGGQTWSAAYAVARAGVDAPVYVQPAIAVSGARVHVAYVAGRRDGAWDVWLATSADGGATWQHRRANDDPEACATHTLPALVGDPARGLVHALWLENRFGDGAVAVVACPDDPARPCGANEVASDAAFTLSTSRDVTRWHGDYTGLELGPDGSLWAAWSDTRTGAPAVYVATGRPR